MSSLEEQRAVLQETYQHLREDQARVKKDHSATTHMLETLKSEMQTHLNCITALDQHLAKLGLEQVSELGLLSEIINLQIGRAHTMKGECCK